MSEVDKNLLELLQIHGQRNVMRNVTAAHRKFLSWMQVLPPFGEYTSRQIASGLFEYSLASFSNLDLC